ncbi:PAS domain S-box protein [Ammoniphilus sp. CFH 90114]|uniref:PAS domain S-box protein n=1 Tax=Ammoniphilus sp. CFH 90114 TaxID=2493665 RepID=UPI00100EF8FD|nr:PAS domain S-box protein [Ammoniphilus sp. CFH 90114]RXT02794.1 PAS domain S-box protein [Ammoniphilus sp. CFH 90114]
MILREFFINLSIFSLLVSTPVVIRSFTFNKPIPYGAILGGIYAGFVSVILMYFTIHDGGFVYDIRFAPLILSYAYFGPGGGLITAVFNLAGRLYVGGNLAPVLAGVIGNVIVLSLLHFYMGRFHPIKKTAIYFLANVSMYLLIVYWFSILTDQVIFHIAYLGFILAGLIIGSLLIESHQKLYHLSKNLCEMYKLAEDYQRELARTLNEFHGAIFKFKKKNGRFIHTFAEGYSYQEVDINPRTQVIGKELQDFLPSPFCDHILHHYQAAWEGKVVQFEMTWSQGNSYFFSLRPTMEQGKVIEVVGTGVNITEKKQMEKAIEESEAKYRLIAENTLDLIAVMNPQKLFTFISPSHEVVLGYHPNELIGKDPKFLFPLPEEFERINTGINRMLQEHSSFTFEYRCARKDGGYIQLESRCVPVKGKDQKLEHIVIVSRDITERKQAEELLLRSEKLSIVGELAAGVAHEIRNPLTTLKGFVQLMKEESPKPYTDLLFEELERIELITNEFLTLAKPQAVELRIINLGDLIQQIKEILTPLALITNIQIRIVTSIRPVYIRCDVNQLKQAFINLVKNAIESMPNGGEVIIELDDRDDDYVMIIIQDQGCGIPKDIIPRLGEPFYTLKEKGTGLGLMISQKIIKDHQGSLHIESELNLGTKIKIQLPKYEEEKMKRAL